MNKAYLYRLYEAQFGPYIKQRYHHKKKPGVNGWSKRMRSEGVRTGIIMMESRWKPLCLDAMIVKYISFLKRKLVLFS